MLTLFITLLLGGLTQITIGETNAADESRTDISSQPELPGSSMNDKLNSSSDLIEKNITMNVKNIESCVNGNVEDFEKLSLKRHFKKRDLVGSQLLEESEFYGQYPVTDFHGLVKLERRNAQKNKRQNAPRTDDNSFDLNTDPLERGKQKLMSQMTDRKENEANYINELVSESSDKYEDRVTGGYYQSSSNGSEIDTSQKNIERRKYYSSLDEKTMNTKFDFSPTHKHNPISHEEKMNRNRLIEKLESDESVDNEDNEEWVNHKVLHPKLDAPFIGYDSSDDYVSIRKRIQSNNYFGKLRYNFDNNHNKIRNLRDAHRSQKMDDLLDSQKEVGFKNYDNLLNEKSSLKERRQLNIKSSDGESQKLGNNIHSILLQDLKNFNEENSNLEKTTVGKIDRRDLNITGTNSENLERIEDTSGFDSDCLKLNRDSFKHQYGAIDHNLNLVGYHKISVDLPSFSKAEDNNTFIPEDRLPSKPKPGYLPKRTGRKLYRTKPGQKDSDIFTIKEPKKKRQKI